MNAHDILARAGDMLTERGRDYDHEGGERSMGPAVAAFNALTGRDLSEREGWLLLSMVKARRQCTNPSHMDSYPDCVAYGALMSEAAHIAQGSRCVSETGSDGKTVAENTNANTDPIREPYCGAYEAYSIDVHSCLQCRAQWRADEPRPCQRQDDAKGSDEGWIDHDGSDRCPVDPTIRLEWQPGDTSSHAPAGYLHWRSIKRWRIAEVDGWVRLDGRGPSGNILADLLTRDGRIFTSQRTGGWIFKHDGDPGDIIAYRPA